MEGIKKKLSNLKLQSDEAEERAVEAEKEKKALQDQVDGVLITSLSVSHCIDLCSLKNCVFYSSMMKWTP